MKLLRMIFWGGWIRQFSIPRAIFPVCAEIGAGLMRCGDCNYAVKRPRVPAGMYELPDGEIVQCNTCKGTGFQWISI